MSQRPRSSTSLIATTGIHVGFFSNLVIPEKIFLRPHPLIERGQLRNDKRDKPSGPISKSIGTRRTGRNRCRIRADSRDDFPRSGGGSRDFREDDDFDVESRQLDGGGSSRKIKREEKARLISNLSISRRQNEDSSSRWTR